MKKFKNILTLLSAISLTSIFSLTVLGCNITKNSGLTSQLVKPQNENIKEDEDLAKVKNDWTICSAIENIENLEVVVQKDSSIEDFKEIIQKNNYEVIKNKIDSNLQSQFNGELFTIYNIKELFSGFRLESEDFRDSAKNYISAEIEFTYGLTQELMNQISLLEINIIVTNYNDNQNIAAVFGKLQDLKLYFLSSDIKTVCFRPDVSAKDLISVKLTEKLNNLLRREHNLDFIPSSFLITKILHGSEELQDKIIISANRDIVLNTKVEFNYGDAINIRLNAKLIFIYESEWFNNL